MSCLLITLNKCFKGHKSLGLLLGGVLKMSLSLSLSLSLSIFFGHVMSSHHSEQMSQRSQVSRIALRRCFQNVFVFVFVFLSIFLVRSCLFITLIKCLKGRKSLGSLCNVKSKSEWLSEWQGHLLSCSGQLKTSMTNHLYICIQYWIFHCICQQSWYLARPVRPAVV